MADFNARKKWRTNHPGACVTEYESIMQIVVQILIGWNQENHTGARGIFGIPEAYADCCEEQARYTLHSHITVWVKNFNDVRNLLFHSNREIRERAVNEMQSYFNIIAQATLGDLYEIVPKPDYHSPVIRRLNGILIPPKDQVIRNMRHHIHCLDLHGIVGYYPNNGEMDTSNLVVSEERRKVLVDETVDTNDIVKKNCAVYIQHENFLNDTNKYQLDVLSYTYPYYMYESNLMKPVDCCAHDGEVNESVTLEDSIKQFNLRHHLLQLRFNVHDCYHRPSCFKKGPECRSELPQVHKQVACIQFDEDNSINWYFIDGTIKKVTPFKYAPKRNIGDQFMNVNNDIATTVMACNNNVTSGDKACFLRYPLPN